MAVLTDNYLLLVSIDELPDHVKLINTIMDVVKKLPQISDIPRGVKLLALMFILFLLATRKKAILLEALSKKL